jgi:hypothetical protein
MLASFLQNYPADVLAMVAAELPELNLIRDDLMRERSAAVWASFLRESTYEKIADAPAFSGLDYNLALHTRHVTLLAKNMVDLLADLWGVRCETDVLFAGCLLHDASKLVEMEGSAGTKTEIGRALLHAQLAGVRCLEAGLPAKVANIVTMHPYTPPHIHQQPQSLEFVILTYADLAAADPLFFVQSKPTHFEFAKRFFQL